MAPNVVGAWFCHRWQINSPIYVLPGHQPEIAMTRLTGPTGMSHLLMPNAPVAKCACKVSMSPEWHCMLVFRALHDVNTCPNHASCQSQVPTSCIMSIAGAQNTHHVNRRCPNHKACQSQVPKTRIMSIAGAQIMQHVNRRCPIMHHVNCRCPNHAEVKA